MPPEDCLEEVILFPSKDYWNRQHLVPWDAGNIEYKNLKTELCNILKNISYVYVLGAEKKEWLKEIIDLPIIDLSQMPYIDSLKKSAPSNLCQFRKRISYGNVNKYGCPYENVQRMIEWFWKYLGPNSTPERSLQYLFQLECLTKMTANDIACLKESFILSFAAQEIKEIWLKLPKKYQLDQRFIDTLKEEEEKKMYSRL